MLRLNVIVTDNGELEVQEQQATIMSNDDVVMDSTSYDILMNEIEVLQEQNEFLNRLCDSTLDLAVAQLDKIPQWVWKLIDKFVK